jgi:hypothetical protein
VTHTFAIKAETKKESKSNFSFTWHVAGVGALRERGSGTDRMNDKNNHLGESTVQRGGCQGNG